MWWQETHFFFSIHQLPSSSRNGKARSIEAEAEAEAEFSPAFAEAVVIRQMAKATATAKRLMKEGYHRS